VSKIEKFGLYFAGGLNKTLCPGRGKFVSKIEKFALYFAGGFGIREPTP
jgi:hypothetical protein